MEPEQPPKDVTHGGVAKKKFEPKVPQRRVKKERDDKAEAQQSDRKPQRKEFKEKEKPKLIQREGVFSEFSASSKSSTPRVSSGGGFSSRINNSSFNDVKEEWKPKKREKTDNVLSDSPEPEDSALETPWFMQSARNSRPLVLPLQLSTALDDGRAKAFLVSNTLQTSSVTADLAAIQEPRALDTLQRANAAGDEAMFLIQLPDTLPFKTSSAQDTSEKPAPEPVSGGLETVEKPFENTLRSLPDGVVGKLRIRKSGKAEIVIGPHVLDLASGVPCSFLQTGVVIDAVTKEMLVLGDVAGRLVATPNVEQLLAHAGHKD